MIHYELGMELALPEPNVMDLPDGWTRESVLASVVHQVPIDSDGDYELRLILRHDVPVDCPHDETEGEMLFIVAEGRGGPIDPKDFIAEADRLGRSGTLDDALAPLLVGPALGAKRMLILPKWCLTQWAKVPADHPLQGVCFVPAAEVRKLLEMSEVLEQLDHLRKLLDYCERSRVVISARLS